MKWEPIFCVIEMIWLGWQNPNLTESDCQRKEVTLKNYSKCFVFHLYYYHSMCFFERKAEVKLRNYLKGIIEIVRNRAGKGSQTPFTTTFPICGKQQDSGHLQKFFKNKTKYFTVLCRT